MNLGTSHPVARFPMGMPPRKAQLYTLMTRPRISLVVINCTSEVTVAKTAIIDAPTTNNMTYERFRNRENENPEMPRPRQISILRANRPLLRIFPNPATASDPQIEPTPIRESRLP